MAGIGFELKKIFKRRGILNYFAGAVYASAVTIGPTLMIVAVLLMLYTVLPYMEASVKNRELFSSTLLYCFIFPMIFSTPMNAVLSRYVADRIYLEKYDEIMPCIRTGMAVTLLAAAAAGIGFCLAEYKAGGVEPLYVFVSYCFFISMTMVFYLMTYVSILKEYRRITLCFAVGLGIGSGAAWLWESWLQVEVTRAILYGMTLAFLIVALLLYAHLKSFFRIATEKRTGITGYLKKYPGLFLTNLFYVLGLYGHNFVFWTTDLQLKVAKVFLSAPSYDMAGCLAMFSNITCLVIFMTRVETEFAGKYQVYCSAVIRGSRAEIITARRAMMRVMKDEIFFLLRIQFVITTVIFLAAMLVLPRLGFGGLVLRMYPALSAGYLVTFAMYALIIFLFYFDDRVGSMMTALVFCAGTAVCSIAATGLERPLAGFGLFGGAMLGWTAGFFRLVYIQKHLDHFAFCRGSVMPVSKKGTQET